MLILCIVCFLLPFAGRGAKLAINSMVNNVADWLPQHYQETKELEEFKKYFFGGGQFVVVSGPWCREGNGTYARFKRKIYEESLDYQKELEVGSCYSTAWQRTRNLVPLGKRPTLSTKLSNQNYKILLHHTIQDLSLIHI